MSDRKSYEPKMHSAEHLLNGTMVKMFNKGRSFTQHIEKKKSKCDYHFDRNLTENEVSLIEDIINKIIEEDVHVVEEFLSIAEAQKVVALNKLPEDHPDMIRIVKMGEFDICPCIGEHVKSTKEIGGFKIISTDFYEGVLRIRFKRTENND